MKMPIVIEEHGDVMVFKTSEHAERYLEPIDVRNVEYVAYDGSGKRLRLAMTGPTERVSLESVTPEIDCADELRKVLVRFLERCGQMEERFTTMPLPDLLALFVARHGDSH